MKVLLSKHYTDLFGSRPRSKSSCLGLHVCFAFIQFCLLTEGIRSVRSNPVDPDSICSSSDHASCSRHDMDGDGHYGCEIVMTRDKISSGDLFDKLMDKSNCSGEFILGKTGFNLTIVDNYDTRNWTHCATGFDPHRTWDLCSGLDSYCGWSVEVCDADRPGEDCFIKNSTHVNGLTEGRLGSNDDHFRIHSVFVDGQLPCTRCLLQLREYYEDGSNKTSGCFPVVIRRDESASKDNPGSHQETGNTTMAGTPGVSDEEIVKTTATSTTVVKDEEMVKTTSTTDGTKPVLQTTQSGGDSDDGNEQGIVEKGTKSGNCNTQAGHIIIFLSTMFTFIIVLV